MKLFTCYLFELFQFHLHISGNSAATAEDIDLFELQALKVAAKLIVQADSAGQQYRAALIGGKGRPGQGVRKIISRGNRYFGISTARFPGGKIFGAAIFKPIFIPLDQRRTPA